jgi:serine/threonine protein kinase
VCVCVFVCRARTSPELLRLDYREHPLIKSLPEFALILDFLNACFEVEPKNRKSAAQLLEMPLLQKGRQPQF